MKTLPAINKKQPVYYNMVDSLRKKIDNGFFGVGQQIPSEIELATLYNISRSSVRQGLNSLLKVGKIQKISGKGTFVKSSYHSSYSRNTVHKTVSLIVPSIQDPFVTKIHSGIVNILEDANYSLSVLSSENSAKIEATNLTRSIELGNVGIILLPLWGLENAKEVENLYNNGIPLVLVDRNIPSLSIDCISTDNFRGGFIATEYLLKMGHKRIGMIRGVSGSANDNRYNGYCNALKHYNIPLDESIVVNQEHYDHFHEPLRGGENEMTTLMNNPDRPTAVFAANDILAFGAEQVALKMGIKVPDDISIMGFDNLQHALLAPVPLTTINQPAFEIGKTAATLLLDNIKSMAFHTKEKVQRIEFLPSLIIRKSVKQINQEG